MIQRARRITPLEFAGWLEAEPTSAFLGRLARVGPVRAALRLYWRAALAALRRRDRRARLR